MEWINQRILSPGENTTSAMRENILGKDYPMNNPRKLNEIQKLSDSQQPKEDTNKSPPRPLHTTTRVRLMADANSIGTVERHSNVSQFVVSEGDTIIPSSKAHGRAELYHQSPLKTKELQGSIRRQHELFKKAYKDLQQRNKLLETTATPDRRQQQQQHQGRGSNGGYSRKETNYDHFDAKHSKSQIDLHKGSKQSSSYKTTDKIRGGKSHIQNRTVDSRGPRFREGPTQNTGKGSKSVERRGSIKQLYGNSIQKDQGGSINGLHGDSPMTNQRHPNSRLRGDSKVRDEQGSNNGSHNDSKMKDQRGYVNGLQSDSDVRVRVGLINGLPGHPINVEKVGAEVKQTAHPIRSGQRNSLAINNVQVLPSNDTYGGPHIMGPDGSNLAMLKNTNDTNGTNQMDLSHKSSYKDIEKMGEPLAPHSIWSLRNNIDSYNDLMKKVVLENSQRANDGKVSILDKYVFPVKHANSEDKRRTTEEAAYQRHRFHDGLQNFEPDHHVLQVDRSPKELAYKFQSDTDNPHGGDREEDRESTRPETCKGCMNIDFTYLVNGSRICQKGRKTLDLLILVASDPVNELARTAIRTTWGRVCRRPDSNIACVFMIANTANHHLNQQVYKESLQHQDIVIFSFMDAYTNLTFKSLMGLRWSRQFCSQAAYVMKTDEDVYVNTHQIPIMLQAAPIEGFVGGFCWGPSRPSRDPSNKWSVSHNQYAKEFFPPMCSGTGYIISHDLVRSILKVSPNIPFFNLEDVYIAFCFQQLGILPVNLQGFSNMRTDFQACQYKHDVMTSHQISEMEMIDFWEEIQSCPDQEFSPQELYNPLPLPDLTV